VARGSFDDVARDGDGGAELALKAEPFLLRKRRRDSIHSLDELIGLLEYT
jgi:hypothetical protein